MNEAETSEKAGQGKVEKRVRIVEPQPEILPTVKWKTIRFIELFFALACMSFLLVLFIMNPIYDDYMRFCKQLVKPGWLPETTTSTTPTTVSTLGPTPSTKKEDEEMSVVVNKREFTMKTDSDTPGLKTFFFKLSYAIILFTLTTTIILVLLLDHLSRFFGEPINKLPIIFLLAASEILSLIIMVLSVDIFLGAINGLVLAISVLAFAMSICLVMDIVCTSVKGNG